MSLLDPEPVRHATSWGHFFRSRSRAFTTGTHYSFSTLQRTKQLILKNRRAYGTNITANAVMASAARGQKKKKKSSVGCCHVTSGALRPSCAGFGFEQLRFLALLKIYVTL
ncbi:hypothetical protein ISCGN_029784 [Ixodes scapularis]